MRPHRKRPRRYGILAISPLFVLAALFLGFSLHLGDFSRVPLLIIFSATSIYALFITRGYPAEERIARFSRGAGSPNLLLMIWIFVMAGAFAKSAKDMGAISATVDLTLRLLPPEMLLAGIFIAACFISLSIGTSVGTIVALVPVATGLADKTGTAIPLLVAATVGGALFGDNLSFISDTTIAATRSVGCRQSDKFKVNLQIVLPAAVITFSIYLIMGQNTATVPAVSDISLLKVLPYLIVLLMAVTGCNVLIVLLIGNLLTGCIGMATGSYDLNGWTSSMTSGIGGMSELILITMLAGGLLELIRTGGGIAYLIRLLIRRVHSKRGAEYCIAALVSVTNLCTANNTVAILTTGGLAKDICEKYGIDKRKCASLLDTFSCCVQGLLPYGAQLLIAGGMAGISPVAIIPSLYYPMIMGTAALLAIGLRFPRKYS